MNGLTMPKGVLTKRHYRSLLALTLLGLSSACSASSVAPSVMEADKSELGDSSYSQTLLMIDFARDYIGTDYVWGGASPKGFDCSGFIQFVYHKFDISIPRTTANYPKLYSKRVDFEDAQVGDLIIFTGTDPNIRKPGHAGIITKIGKDSLHFIHSSSSKKHFGVTETNYFKSGYPKRYLSIVKMTELP